MSDDNYTQASAGLNQYERLRVPELAALRCGQLLNQIEHQTTVLWLHGKEENANPSLGLAAYTSSRIPWRDLRLASRGVITDERQRMVFENIIATAEQDWTEYFQSRWHVRLLLDQNIQIEVDRLHYLAAEEGPSLSQIIVRACALVLDSVREITQSILSFFLSSLDSRYLEFFRLGQHVDHLVHPVPAFRELQTSGPARQHTESMAAVTEPQSVGQPSWNQFPEAGRINIDMSSRTDLSPRDIVWRLPQIPLTPCVPAGTWWDEFLFRALSCGFSRKRLSLIRNRFESSGHQPVIAATILVNDLQEDIATDVSETQHRSDQPSGQCGGFAAEPHHTQGADSDWELTSAGLEINERLQEIRVTGSTETVHISHSTTFKILVFLARRGEAYTRKTELVSKWSLFNPSRSPNARSVSNSQICKIKKILEGLSLGIHKEGQGDHLRWRIVRP